MDASELVVYGGCLHCRQPILLPDHVVSGGGSVACPLCLRMSTFAPIDVPHPGPFPMDTTPSGDGTFWIRARRGGLVLAGIATSFVVALLLPWDAVGEQKATTEIAHFAGRQREAALVTAAPATTDALRTATTEARRLLDSKQFQSAATILEPALARTRATMHLQTAPSFVTALDEATRLRTLIGQVQAAAESANHGVAHETTADAATARKQFADADKLYATALTELGIDKALHAYLRLDVDAARSRVEAKRARAAKAASRQRKTASR